MQGWKMRDMNFRHQIAGVENARHENADKGPLNGCVCVRQTDYLKIYLTDLRQICRVGRTMAVGP